MDAADRVSIITPAYNAGKYIAQTIESVIAQTYPDWEMIIVDDGSGDDTAAIIKKYAARDSRIIYIYQENGRQGKARNKGLSIASGKYIAFLDADDIWIKEKLDVQLSFLKQNNADLVFSDAYIFNDQLTEEQKMQVKPGVYKGTEGVLAFLERNKIPVLTVLTTQEAVKASGGFSEEKGIQNAEDYHLWLKMLMAGKTLLAMDHTLAYYRIHQQSATSGDKEAIVAVLNVFISLVQAYPELKPAIVKSIVLRIDLFLLHHIVTDGKQLKELLVIRNAYSPHKINLNRWLFLYQAAHYRIFRKLFLLLNKIPAT